MQEDQLLWRFCFVPKSVGLKKGWGDCFVFKANIPLNLHWIKYFQKYKKASIHYLAVFKLNHIRLLLLFFYKLGMLVVFCHL